MTDTKPDMLSEHGMRCPDCGQSEAFRVEETRTTVVRADDGIAHSMDLYDDNPCMCDDDNCGTWQTVGYFRVKPEPE